MRASALFSAAAAAAALLLAAGCGSSGHAAASATAPPAQSSAPAPADPDLGTVTERFYQYVEGGHWQFAYAMLAPRYRARLTQDDLVRRYAGFTNADVSLRHTRGTVVTARLDAVDRTDRTRKLHATETVTLTWDGADWKIDDITRR